MKNKNIKKLILALALASTTLGPTIDKAYATETTSLSEYEEVYENFTQAIEDAKAVKNSYKYINADDYYKKKLDDALAGAEQVKENISPNTVSDDAKINMATSTTYIKFAITDLNGEKASVGELKDLIESHNDFLASDAYKNATIKQKEAYLDAHDKADRVRTIYNYDEESLSKTMVDSYTKDLREAKANIAESYAPVEIKAILKEEIEKASPLRDKGVSYTQKSFDTFMSALRLAETSVEDKSNIKSATEYKEIAETLKSARLALVEVKMSDEKLEAVIKKLEEAIDTNKIAIKSGQTLLEIAPKQVAPVKDKLIKIMEDAREVIEKSEAYLEKIKGIRG
ncbi:hypothetical protein [uncultured Anaerococcus sp.]|uniref:hypothetical protein n=1 Tax=uncultured Anaerococcus sp. TaxID=293428 RepID=UPI0025EC61DC|nr:hypothetical protein [uncultured Anaerococcus sp.]